MSAENARKEFYSRENVEKIQKAQQQIKNGQVVIKTMEELEAMELEKDISGFSE